MFASLYKALGDLRGHVYGLSWEFEALFYNVLGFQFFSVAHTQLGLIKGVLRPFKALSRSH